MFPEITDKRNIRVNLTHLDVQGVVRLCEEFPIRYFTEIVNGYFLMTIRDVTYGEFIQILSIYGYFLQSGRLHVVLRPVPHVEVHLTSTEERSK